MRACEACGAAVPDGAAFCPTCGTRLGPAERPSAAALMRSERKLITVLFADIKGSIDLVARTDPELAGEILSNVVSAMQAAVRQFGGVVNQIMGDGVMALFGAPLAIEDHAAQACRAALAMRAAIHANVRPRVQVRVGLSSGEVVVRAVTGDVALHYSAAGEAVHLASRMEQVAAPDQIVLTPATLALAEDLIEARSLGKMVIKGLGTPMEPCELLHVGERRTRAARRRRGPAFVGREQEMAQLQDALDHAAIGEARAVRVIAEAGCGKSRLLREFTAERLPQHWTVCQAEALPHRRTSYGTVVDLLGGVFALKSDDDAATRREKALAALQLAQGEAETDLMPALAGLIGLPPPPSWHNLEPRERRARTITAATTALQQVSRHRPTALIVEDAHWLDPESAASIERLGRALPGEQRLAIATERAPETSFADPRDWEACHLAPLDEQGTRALLQSLLLPGPDVPALERRLIEHTRGNPLFIEECLQALVDTGELIRLGDRYRLQRRVEVLRVPDSLRGLLDTRVDRLVDLEKDVLQAAAVVGTSVPADLLRRVVDLEAAKLDPVLQSLCEAGFLVQAGTAEGRAEPCYGFRHGLIRDAAYNGILLRSRIRMHGAVLEALEERNNEADADLLADHATHAEAWRQAVTYSRLAAARALDRYANPESARYYRQALAAADHWPEGEEKDRTLLSLHIGIRWPLFRLGQVDQLLPHLDEAARLAGEHDDYVQLGRSQALRSHVLWLGGKPEEAELAAEAARQIALAHGDRDLEIRAQFQFALVHLTQSRIPEIVATLRDVIDHIGPRPPRRGRFELDARLVVTSLGYLARAHAAAGQFEAAHKAIAEAVEHAAESDDHQDSIYVHTARGVTLTAEGRPHHAVGELERAYNICTQFDIRLLRPVAGGFLALAYAESGRAARGLEIGLEAVEDAERMGFLALHPMRLAILAQAYLLRNELDWAQQTAMRARELAVRIKEPGAGAYATGLLGEVAFRRGSSEVSRALLTAGLRQAEALGLTPLAASLRQRIEEPDNRAHPWLDGVALAP
ncbi:MAG: AAA family ATPase [Acetobacteraceae bacterium]|nr:AAA family ATPase [Acetobacteraceae bacterium]